jgi:hypothetical protein
MKHQEIMTKAADWMFIRGWKRKIAKRREGVYPERSRREQSLFEHTMVELDALLSLLPILKKPNHFNLTEEEEKILIASVIAHDVGKERPEWQDYILGKMDFVSDIDPDLTEKIIPELCDTLGFQEIGEKVMNVIENCINRRLREWMRRN